MRGRENGGWGGESERESVCVWEGEREREREVFVCVCDTGVRDCVDADDDGGGDLRSANMPMLQQNTRWFITKSTQAWLQGHAAAAAFPFG